MKSKYTALLQRLKEFNSDIETILQQADEVYQSCQVTGYLTQKVAGKDAIELLERLPAVAVQAVNTKLLALKWLTEQAEKEEGLDSGEEYTIKVVLSEVQD